ncbi:Nonribosomal peptide synthetase 4 [Cytospora mali]|uniref:Nonribosomal peptide synthetase 4 n=1 Tax=Cytospora mali TaxID=578113 RepID=A0A194VUB6_CYTMA|nr:Nonribosomal peptide synthetase 4 [Valsa mali]
MASAMASPLPLPNLNPEAIAVGRGRSATPHSNTLALPPPPVNRLVQHVFYEQVASCPDVPAICSWDGYFTYNELDQLSSRLAVHLSSFGLEPDTIVPILFDKSAITIIAMLAILKSGSAFTALDTSHPHERLQEIIKDTKANLILVSPSQTIRFSELPGLSVKEISHAMLSDLPPAPGSPSPHPDASPSNIMYTIFTSGSTGRPKGVMIEHRAWLTSALAYGSDQGISHSSRVLQFASYAFDMSLMEIFTTLLFGGCICLPSDEDRFGGIENFVNKTGVNTLMLTPSYAKLLDPAVMPSVKSLITGGEAVPSDLLETWAPRVQVYIAYGPTEAAIQASGVQISTRNATSMTGLIGRPTGCNIWIVREDNHNELVPAGETGELLIEGHTLARGYLGDEEKTKAAFVDFCIGSETRRAFKTGDLVRQAEDGNLIFIGRKDTQVKVQGMRFELTEIEARLSLVLPPGSNFCVEKVDVPSSPNQATLATFISPSIKVWDGDVPEVCWDHVKDVLSKVPEIMDGIAKVLPAPMIPSIYIPITFIPLTSSHKKDRKRLRQLFRDLDLKEVQRLKRSGNSQESTRLLSANGLTMRELWAGVLNREEESIGPGDNFIHLGGDSVTSIRLVSAARKRGIHLTSSMILSTPVLSDLAKKVLADDAPSKYENIEPFALLEGRSGELRATAAAICRVGIEEIEDVLPMTISQMRWYGKTLMKPDAWLDQYHFRLPSDVDLVRFKSALNFTIEAAELLRARAIATSDRKLFQAIVKFSPVEPAIVNDSLESYLDRDLKTPMGLGAPLNRCAIVKDINSADVFVWTIHHAIYDGFSLPMLFQTIDEFYYHGLKPTAFTPFNQYIRGPKEQELAEGESFWRQYLISSSWAKFPVLPAPEEKVPPSMDRFLKTVNIPSQQPAPGTTGGDTTPVTTADLIRVAYAITLSPYSGDRTSILFLESLSGRNSTLPGIDRVAGPTLLTIPTRLRIAPSKSWGEVLAEAQKSLVGRMRFENFPLPRLLPLASGLELRNVLMIEDEAFLIHGTGKGLFGDGKEELKLDETDALPMMFRCIIRGNVLEVDIRFDKSVVHGEEIKEFVDTFEKVFNRLSHGSQDRPASEILSSSSI